MQVKDIMTYGVDFIQPSDSVKSAAEKMRDRNVGACPVFDNKQPVGMITDRDITVRCVSQGCNPSDAKVEDVMSREVIFCKENMDVDEAAHIMEYKKIRRLLVENENREVVGILSLGDLAMSTTNELSGEVLRDVSGISYPNR